jgi:hypothetical protein
VIQSAPKRVDQRADGACLDLYQIDELLRLLMSGAMQSRGGKQTNVILPAVKSHESLDVPRQRRRARRAVLQRHNRKETPLRHDQAVLLLHAQGSLPESDFRYATFRYRFFPSGGAAARLLKPVHKLGQRSWIQCQWFRLHNKPLYATL